MRLRVVRLDPDLPLPSPAHTGDAGLDLCARDACEILRAGGRVSVRTGLAVDIEAGHVGLVAPRSGLAASHGLTVLNSPGVIDSGFRGEIVVILGNFDPTTNYAVARGDRIAQLLVVPVSPLEIEEVSDLSSSPRGRSGLGDSGR